VGAYKQYAALQAVEEQGAGRAINRHRFSLEEAEANLERPVVRALLQLMRFRNTHPAFNGQVLRPPARLHS
jgi:sucrose phosphorylase